MNRITEVVGLASSWAVGRQEQVALIVPAGWTLWVAHLVTPDICHVAISYRPLEAGGASITFFSAAVVMVEGCSEGGRRCRHLRFARLARLEAGELRALVPVCDLALRRGCHAWGLNPKYCPGGFQPYGYDDEVAVADYGVSGTRGWIVPAARVDEIRAEGRKGAQWSKELQPLPVPSMEPRR